MLTAIPYWRNSQCGTALSYSPNYRTTVLGAHLYRFHRLLFFAIARNKERMYKKKRGGEREKTTTFFSQLSCLSAAKRGNNKLRRCRIQAQSVSESFVRTDVELSAVYVFQVFTDLRFASEREQRSAVHTPQEILILRVPCPLPHKFSSWVMVGYPGPEFFTGELRSGIPAIGLSLHLRKTVKRFC